MHKFGGPRDKDLIRLIKYLEETAGIVYLDRLVTIAKIPEGRARSILSELGFSQVTVDRPGYRSRN